LKGCLLLKDSTPCGNDLFIKAAISKDGKTAK
jgi:hypothetical protein